MKVRVQATPTEDTMFPAYGAQIVHMPFGNVYTSLQTGVVDAAENGVNVFLVNKHYEVAPIMSMTEHEANNNLLWISDKLWSSLTAEQKGWVQAAADEVGKTQPGKALDLEKQSATKLKSMGVKVVTDVDKSGFVKIAALPREDGQGSRAARRQDPAADQRRQVARARAVGHVDERSLVLQRQRQLKWPALDWLEAVLMMLCGFTLAGFSSRCLRHRHPRDRPAVAVAAGGHLDLLHLRHLHRRRGGDAAQRPPLPGRDRRVA
jgi:hypothetical protein